MHIKDCHDCDFLAPHTKYTRLTFVAALSPDREFKAKALFMASKAEQGRRYNANPNDGNNVNPSAYFKTSALTRSGELLLRF